MPRVTLREVVPCGQKFHPASESPCVRFPGHPMPHSDETGTITWEDEGTKKPQLSGIPFDGENFFKTFGPGPFAGTAVGTKDDNDKPRYDLIPLEALDEVVSVLTHGARKYAPENWRTVSNARARYFAAAMRHLTASMRGDKFDTESHLSHLAHAATCLLFMLELEE